MPILLNGADAVHHPVFVAAAHGDVDALVLLLNLKTLSLETSGDWTNKSTPLHAAAYYGHADALVALLKSPFKALVNARDYLGAALRCILI